MKNEHFFHIFSYGSNLHIDDMAVDFSALGGDPAGVSLAYIAWLNDHELVFNRRSARRKGGVISIVPIAGQAVDGIVLSATREAIHILDRKEGVGIAYERVGIEVADANGIGHHVETYIVPPERAEGFVAPHPDYLAICRDARLRLGLDICGLDRAARGSAPFT